MFIILDTSLPFHFFIDQLFLPSKLNNVKSVSSWLLLVKLNFPHCSSIMPYINYSYFKEWLFHRDASRNVFSMCWMKVTMMLLYNFLLKMFLQTLNVLFQLPACFYQFAKCQYIDIVFLAVHSMLTYSQR